VDEPDPPIQGPAVRESSARPSDRIALGSALLGGLLAAAFVAIRLASGAQTPVNPDVLGVSTTNQPVRVQSGVQASPVAVSSASPVPASPTARSNTEARAHIANTDAQGVVLRASPRDDDRTPRGFLEGDAVTVLERNGSDWARVRGDNGQEGWVPTRYLGP
jgi:hypothetical protein